MEQQIPFEVTVSHLQKAPFWRRLVASLIDTAFQALLIIFINVILGFFLRMQNVDFSSNGSPLLVVALLLILTIFLYEPILLATRGSTLGRMIMHIWVFTESGRHPSFGKAILRSLAKIASSSIFGLGFVWMFFDPERQAWHDKIAGTHSVLTDEEYLPIIGPTHPPTLADWIAFLLFIAFIAHFSLKRIPVLLSQTRKEMEPTSAPVLKFVSPNPSIRPVFTPQVRSKFGNLD